MENKERVAPTTAQPRIIKSQYKDSENLSIITGFQLLTMDIKEIFALYGLFPIGVSFIIGASDTGKSAFLRFLAICIASRRPFLGREYNGRYGRVIVVLTEDDKYAIAVLLAKQNKTLQLANETFDNIDFIFDTYNVVEPLRQYLKDNPVDAVILDAFGDLFNEKDLNQSNQARTFLKPYSELSREFSTPFIFLHHTNKRSEYLEPSKNNSNGSQAIEAKSRFVAELRQDRTNSNIRHLCIVKANYLPSEEKKSSYALYFDENMTFSFTGQRVPFEQLSASCSGGKQSKGPESIDDANHIDFLESIYSKTSKPYSQKDLNGEICKRFNVSDQPARKYIEYYTNKRWIINNSSAKNRFEFVLGDINDKLAL